MKKFMLAVLATKDEPLEHAVGSRQDHPDAQDPQVPVSIWYLTDALHVGFRVVRPLQEPSDDEKKAVWEASEPIMKERAVPLER